MTEPDFKTYAGFEQLYGLFAEKMFRIAVSQTGDEEIAKEIIQEIFKSIWERRETLKIDGLVENYLMRALKLKIIDHYRSKYSSKVIAKEEIPDLHCNATNCTDDTVAFNELASNIRQLVDRLPCQCRKVFMMSHMQGMSNKEIASALLITERAVAYHLVRAKEFLETKLPDYISTYDSAV
ncbi:MAG: sigma-70 family RNA polymerase sigma factor [Bacteroidota bacterium]